LLPVFPTLLAAVTKVLHAAVIRVLNGEQTGYAYPEELTPESLVSAAQTAASIASSTPGKPAVIIYSEFSGNM